MAPGWMQIAVVVILLILLFGRGKISDMMGDVAKGIKSFKKGLADDEDTAGAKSLESKAAEEAGAGKTIDVTATKTGEKTKAG